MNFALLLKVHELLGAHMPIPFVSFNQSLAQSVLGVNCMNDGVDRHGGLAPRRTGDLLSRLLALALCRTFRMHSRS